MAGKAFSTPGILLRVEGIVVLAALLVVYSRSHYSWTMFAILFLAPDISILGYIYGKQVGASIYNSFHTYSVPVVLMAVVLLADLRLPREIVLIWLCHISMDRMLGFGLKYTTGFKDTHLGRV